MNQGSNGTWYLQGAKHGFFRDERYCDEIVNIRGIVGRLTHGRFIAGYMLSVNDERVYFPEVFDDEKEAARMADEHARVIAEQEQEYAQRFDDAQRLETPDRRIAAAFAGMPRSSASGVHDLRPRRDIRADRLYPLRSGNARN